MGTSDPEARLEGQLQDLCKKWGYEFKRNKRGRGRMVVPVKYNSDTFGTYNATKHWRFGIVTEVHYTVTYVPHPNGPISLRKVVVGYNGGDPEIDDMDDTNPAKLHDISQQLLGRFDDFFSVIPKLEKNIKHEKKKVFLTKAELKKQNPQRYGKLTPNKYC